MKNDPKYPGYPMLTRAADMDPVGNTLLAIESGAIITAAFCHVHAKHAPLAWDGARFGPNCCVVRIGEPFPVPTEGEPRG